MSRNTRTVNMLKVLIDARERCASEWVRSMRLLPELRGVEVDIGTLPVGDLYISCQDRVLMCVERKTHADLEASIIDGRYKDQAERMRLESFPYTMYLIVGKQCPGTSVPAGKRALSSLSHVQMQHAGTHVIQCASDQDVPYLVAKWCQYIREDGVRAHTTRFTPLERYFETDEGTASCSDEDAVTSKRVDGEDDEKEEKGDDDYHRSLPTVQSLQRTARKRNASSVREGSVMMLSSVVSQRMADAICNHYGTLQDFYAFMQPKSPRVRSMLIAGIPLTERQNIGAKRAEKLCTLLFHEQVGGSSLGVVPAHADAGSLSSSVSTTRPIPTALLPRDRQSLANRPTIHDGMYFTSKRRKLAHAKKKPDL